MRLLMRRIGTRRSSTATRERWTDTGLGVADGAFRTGLDMMIRLGMTGFLKDSGPLGGSSLGMRFAHGSTLRIREAGGHGPGECYAAVYAENAI